MPFIVINEDQQITPIYRDVSMIPKPLRDFQQRNLNIEFKEYDKMSQKEIIDKILEICVPNESKKRQLLAQGKLNNIVFTLDNFMKLVLIYLRVRCHLPIILMGETGVGKTSLVDYLSKVIDAECMTINIHAGITDDEIARFMADAQNRAKNYYNNKKID